MENLIVENRIVYEISDRCYLLKVTDKHSKGDYHFEVSKGGNIVRSFTYAAYKAYNFSAHFKDIVDTEMWRALPVSVRSQRYKDGYGMATWNGF